MTLWQNLFGKTRAPAPVFDAPAPDERLAVIGDVHGRLDLLTRLLDRIDAEHVDRVLFVGDLVDRGEDSRAVIERVHALCTAPKGRAICLLGNHEQMMIDFIDAPEAKGPRWLRNGGLQTLASFGIRNLAASMPDQDLRDAADVVSKLIGTTRMDWLRSLPLIWQSGTVCVVHAALAPDRPPADQDSDVLIWGHSDFLSKPRTDGVWVVHGHTVVEEPTLSVGRIAVDTGAYFSGCLTAAILSPQGEVRFLSSDR